MKVKRPERPIDPADWHRQMNVRLRAEYIPGAEELERVLRRYPGDVVIVRRSH